MDVLLCALALVLVAVVVYRGWRQGPEHDLSGKVVLLTGAGGGLGRCLALSLAARGCRLACVDVAARPNEETVSMVLSRGRQHGAKPLAKAYTADLSQREDISALVKNVITDFGQVDILVNNAGQLQGGAIWDLTDDQLDLVLDVNLRACILLVKYVMPHMKARREGHIVTISSISALVPNRKLSAYSATKAGVSHVMECVYHDLQHEGLHKHIHVTTIQPYFINTFTHLESAFKYTGPFVKRLLGFLDAEATAQDITWCIATRQHLVTLPSHLGALGNAVRLLPRVVQTFITDYIIQPVDRDPFPYRARHARLDADLMFELLSKRYDLTEDPEAVCRAMRAEYSAKGKDLPYDFTPFSESIRAFYSARGQSPPEEVKSVFAL